DGHEGAERNPHRGALGEVLPFRPGPWHVVLDWCATQSDLIVELTRRENIVTGHPVVTVHPSGLPHADLCAESYQRGILVAGDSVDEESRVLQRLATSLHLGAAEDLRIGRVPHRAIGTTLDLVQTGHHRG